MQCRVYNNSKMLFNYIYKPLLPWRSIACVKFSNRLLSSDITAGILIIGDEILKGQTGDCNSPFLVKNLNEIGIKISRITVLPDNVHMVADEVSVMSKQCTVVITSGGIGPTHDDITYQAVAKACGKDLAQNEELASLFRNYFGPEATKNPAVTKFCSIPQSAVLNYSIDKYGNKTKFPIVSMQNIYMLPGVPQLLRKGFQVFKSNFLLHNQPYYTRDVFVSLDEFHVTSILNKAVELFREHVKFGSYPSFSHNYYRVKLVLEGSDQNWINKAYEFLIHSLPNETIVIPKLDTLASAEEELFAMCETHSPLQEAIAVTKNALEKYRLTELCVCFNGGKDCVALLHLLYCCVHNRNIEHWNQIHVLYVRDGDAFHELEDFLNTCAERYRLNIVTITGDLRTSFGMFLKERSHIKAVFMGVRRVDPGAENLEHFCLTDDNWPTVVRILPLLNWSYRDVWTFIRSLQLPYCTLYDRGYTSLGNRSNTVPHPALLNSNQTDFRSYRPAYLLKDSENERSGRK